MEEIRPSPGLPDTTSRVNAASRKPEHAVYAELFSGAMAGGVSRTATAPIDRVKNVKIVQTRGAKFHGVLHSVRVMAEEDGVRSLWRGNGANVMKGAAETAVRFMVYDRVKVLLGAEERRDGKEISSVHRLFAGAVAGLAGQGPIYPLETIKTRLATAKTGVYRGMGDAARSMYREDWRLFFRGMSPSMIGIAPNVAIMFVARDEVQRRVQAYSGGKHKEGVIFFSGVIASIIASSVTYPLVVMRTRLQAHGLHDHAEEFHGLRDCIRKTWKVRCALRARGRTRPRRSPAPACRPCWRVRHLVLALTASVRTGRGLEGILQGPRCQPY